MSEHFYVVLILIFVLAGMVKGITGMGLPTVAIGLLGTLMPLPIAVTLLIMPSLVTNIWQLCSGPALFMLIKRLGWMMVFIVFSTIVGSSLLANLNEIWARFALGSALIFYAIYTLLARQFSVSRHIEKWLSPLVGVMTGLITGTTGIFVIPAVPYLQSLDLSKDELVQALGLSFSISTVALAIGLFVHNHVDLDQFALSSLVVVPALMGMWLGQKIRAKMSQQRFKQFFLLFLIILGLELISSVFLIM